MSESAVDRANRLIGEMDSSIIAAEKAVDLEQVWQENADVRANILSTVETALREKNLSPQTKKELKRLSDKWHENYEAADANNDQAKVVVQTDTVKQVSDLRTLNDKLDALSDLNGSGVVDTEIRDFVTEKSLKQALSRADKNAGGIDVVYERVVGFAPDWNDPKAAEKFQQSLRLAMDIIRQLSWDNKMNAGLDAFLMGKTDVFVKAVRERAKANGGPLPVEIKDSNLLSPATHNVIGALMTAGVAVLSQGMVTAGHEKHAMEAEDFIQKVEEDKEGGFWNGLGSALVWVKEAVMGRKLSITFGEERVKDYMDNIKEHAKKVMDLTPEKNVDDTSSIEDKELRSAFESAVRIVKQAKLDPKGAEEFKMIQKALIQSYIVGRGFEKQGTNWSASIGLLMPFGVHHDSIAVDSKQTASSEYNKVEQDLIKSTIDDFKSHGIGIEKKDGKWIYTVPKKVQFPGDIEPLDVMVDQKLLDPQTSSQDEKSYVFTSDSPRQIHLSDNGNGGYELSLIPSEINEVKIVNPDQDANLVKNLRDGKENLFEKKLDDLLYAMGHSKDKQIQTVISDLSRQDYQGAVDKLAAMRQKGKYKGLATRLLLENAKSDNMASWTTYMYGSTGSRAKDITTQNDADKIRDIKVITAEHETEEKYGITKHSDEKDFKLGKWEKYTPRQASELFPGQEMTVSVTATPKDGLHRMDFIDGSIAMSEKKVNIQDVAHKRQIIDAMSSSIVDNKGIKVHFESFKTFISERAPGEASKVNIDAYKRYLATGDISELGIAGLQVQAGKEPKVFEGRAMIAGNKCLNRLYGIAYPLFTFSGQAQELNPVVSYSTPVNDVSVLVKQDVVGLNTLGIAVKAISHITHEKPTPTPSGGGTSSNTSAGAGGGGNATTGGK